MHRGISAIVAAMVTHRVLRRWLSSALVLALLFAQIAVAAYACPFTPPSLDTKATATPCADMMAAGAALDPAQPGLCLQHCQFGNTQQPADSVPPQPAPTSEPALLFMLDPAPPSASGPTAREVHERRRNRAPPIAHSIAHCCYRI